MNQEFIFESFKESSLYLKGLIYTKDFIKD